MAGEVNYKNIASIDTSGAAKSGTWAVLAAGLETISFSRNEVVETKFFVSGGGFSDSDVVGQSPKYALTGIRKYGDAAQDYILSSATADGLFSSRRSQFKMEQVDAVSGLVVETKIWDCTIVGAVDSGGVPNAQSAIAINIDCNGAPNTTVPYTAAQTLSVVSLAGTGAGKSSIYINPVKGASNSIKWKITTVKPAVGDILTTGWSSAITVGADSIASGVTTGDVVLFAEVVTATNALVKAGFATITVG